LTDLQDLEERSASDILSWALNSFGSDFAIASSFQREDMIVTDLASRIAPRFRVFTLDTGRLPEETYQMVEEVRQRYGVSVEMVFPDGNEVERMVAEFGPNLFYSSPEARHLCCDARKTRPLARKLRELRAWATGLRREQSATRAHVLKVEESDGITKINPLADWSWAQVEEYTRQHNLPVHPLYARGYASIGCAPCTRAIEPGEDERAGRWWWEQGKKECGIHFAPDGSVRRGALSEKDA
jgi:thioredoxin-dependent adenylylsulfate APS reductase